MIGTPHRSHTLLAIECKGSTINTVLYIFEKLPTTVLTAGGFNIDFPRHSAAKTIERLVRSTESRKRTWKTRAYFESSTGNLVFKCPNH